MSSKTFTLWAFANNNGQLEQIANKREWLAEGQGSKSLSDTWTGKVYGKASSSKAYKAASADVFALNCAEQAKWEQTNSVSL